MRDVCSPPLLLVVLAAALCCACSGGQSGNEGEIPSAPCARQGALVTGTIASLGGACVSIEVHGVVQGIDTSAGTEIRSWPEAGDIVEGRLATFYAYTRQFEPGQSVAVLIDNGPDASPSLQVMPLVAGKAQIEWASVRYEAPLEELIAPDCDARQTARRDQLIEVGETFSSASSSTSTPTSPAVEFECEP